MTLPEIDPIKLSKWQGGVDEKLTNLNGRMGNIEIKVDGLPDRIEKRVEKIINNKESNRVTFQWIMEKVALPLIVGGGSAAATIYAIIKTLQ